MIDSEMHHSQDGVFLTWCNGLDVLYLIKGITRVCWLKHGGTKTLFGE